MIELIFTPGDVARIRFAFSPLGELVASLRVLADPSRHALHLPWIRAVRPRLRRLDLDALRAVVPPTGYLPDFLTPPPQTPLPDFAAELELVRATDPARVVEELSWLADALPVGTRDRRTAFPDTFGEDPALALTVLCDQLSSYWTIAVEPYWPRVRDLLETDVLRRSRTLAERGVHGLFGGLHERVGWAGDRLQVSGDYSYRAELDGRGLVLMPSAFSWPDVLTMIPPQQPAVSYPPFGVATLWESTPSRPPHALAALLGKVRAAVLVALGAPCTTSELSRRLGVTAGAVSQHLGVLRGCGLVAGHRVGRQVLYARTDAGDTLVKSAAAPEDGAD